MAQERWVSTERFVPEAFLPFERCDLLEDPSVLGDLIWIHWGLEPLRCHNGHPLEEKIVPWTV